MGDNTRAYLAGPDVFLPNPSEAADEKKRLCRNYGFEGVFPLDADLDLSGLPKREQGLLIGRENEKLIQSCGLLIANLTPFRGPSVDPGTAYEMGFARALRMPVFGYTSTTKLFVDRTRRSVGCHRHDAFRDLDDLQIEDFDMHDNLMIEGAVDACGTPIITFDLGHDPIRNFKGFEACLRVAKRRLGRDRRTT